MESGYYRKSADNEAQRAFGAARYMNGGAQCRRSLDGIMEARMIEEVQKDAIQGRKSEEPWKGRPFSNFGWGGILYPTGSILMNIFSVQG